MLRHRLISLIESHSQQLADELFTSIQHSMHLPSYSRVPESELKKRVSEIYGNLGQWLMARTESDIARLYCEIGGRRFRQGVPLSELLWAIILTKDNLWDFLTRESWPGFEIEVLAEHDLFRAIDHFFNRAMYYAARGFEQAERAEEALAAAAN